MRARRFAAAVMAALMISQSGLAVAQQNPDLARAQQSYERLAFKPCREAAQRALRRPKNSRRDLIDIYRLLGLCNAALNEDEAANNAYQRLLAIDPEYKLDPDLSPQFTSSFKEAKGLMGSRRPIGAKLVPPPVTLRPTRQITLELEVDDPLGMVNEISFSYKRADGASFTSVPVAKGAGRLQVSLPPVGSPGASRAVLDYYVEMRDENGGELGGAGSAAAPQRVVIGEPLPTGPSGAEVVSTPFYKRVWFWTVVGIVAGGAVAAGVAARPSGKVDLNSGVGFAR
jgi:hypothetical protein